MSTVSHSGFSLIEVLVALLVLAIGVLGIVMLQLVTLRATRDTLFQSSALNLATTIAEQVGLSTHSPEMLQQFAQFDYSASDLVAVSGSSCYGSGSSCTPEQIASAAMHEWQQRLRESLPGARLRICRDASPWQASMKSMRWECAAGGDASGATTPLWIKIGWPSSALSTAVPAAPQMVLPIAAFSR